LLALKGLLVLKGLKWWTKNVGDINVLVDIPRKSQFCSGSQENNTKCNFLSIIHRYSVFRDVTHTGIDFDQKKKKKKKKKKKPTHLSGIEPGRTGVAKIECLAFYHRATEAACLPIASLVYNVYDLSEVDFELQTGF
jgi:hypothetical protein